jgi:hypothetical protein
MAMLVHEMWDEGEGHTMLCLAGPDGDGARGFLEPGARLIGTFTAASHFDAMTLYNEKLGREPYVTSHPSDRDPYPEDWCDRQRVR